MLAMAVCRPTSRIIQIMCPFLVSFEKVLSNKSGGAEGTNVANERASATVTEFMSFALVLAEEPRRAREKVLDQRNEYPRNKLTNKCTRRDAGPSDHQHVSRYGRASC
jgi:hypothetical protein